MAFLSLLTRIAALLLVSTLSVHAEIRILDRPMWVFPGQTLRIALELPPGSPDLAVDVPQTLTMFDRWTRDTIQRFYFRSERPGPATVRFTGVDEGLTIELEVLSWGDVFQPRAHEGIKLPRIWPLEEPDYRTLKSQRTLHTDAQVERMKGREPGKLALAWKEMSDEEVFGIVPGPSVARTCLMVLGGYEDARGKGCPICGTEIYKGRSGFYPWKFDPEGHPWKVGCPSCETWFPSNDFANGDMHSGPFPDDGFGCEPVEPVYAKNGKPWRWPFIAYYHQQLAYMRTITRGIPQCAEAFAATGDPAYAHKAAIGLFRMAESMLDMSINLNHRKIAVRNGVYQPPIGAPDPRALRRVNGTFLYIQPNWDTPRYEAWARAWDLIFDKLDGDQALIDFCQANHHPEIKSIDDFRWFIESGVIRVTAQACLDNAVARNYPMQEVAVATMALGLNTPRCEELVDWVLNGPGGIRFGLTNEYFKDGAGHEAGGYNGIQVRDMVRLLRLLDRTLELNPERYTPPRYVSLMDDVKFRLLYDFHLNNSLIGRTNPGTGDSGGHRPGPWPQSEGYPIRRAQFAGVYEQTGDPKFAQALYGPDGKIPASVTDTVRRAEIERIGQEKGWQVATRSNFLDGFGHAILRSGKGLNQRALWMRYGRTVQHRHPDMLTFGLEAFQGRMLPELGYPQGWTYARSWETNWATHYGTHILGLGTGAFPGGRLALFADGAPAQIAVAESEAGDRGWRQRTIVLVGLPDGGCYAVTLERVKGGKSHLHSFHGPDGEATPIGLNLRPQSGGTLLGPDAEYGDDSTIRNVDRELSSFAFLYDVASARPDSVWGMDFALKGYEGVNLRKMMVYPSDSRLSVAKGKAPGGGARPYEMTWSILQRTGQDPLASQFLYVLEPYEGSAAIRSVERLDLKSRDGEFPSLALRVKGDTFSDDLIFQVDPGTTATTPDGLTLRGEFGFVRTIQGSTAAVLANGTLLEQGDVQVSFERSAHTGTIETCDWSRSRITINPAPQSPGDLVGRHLQIHNDGGSHASYTILSARNTGNACEITLDLDPRIGEGFVQSCGDGEIQSHVRLRMASLRGYYAGKTLSNEDGTAVYRLDGVPRRSRKCVIDSSRHGRVSASQLEKEFGDLDGDGLTRYLIYDYGTGDSVTINNWVSTDGNTGL